METSPHSNAANCATVSASMLGARFALAIHANGNPS